MVIWMGIRDYWFIVSIGLSYDSKRSLFYRKYTIFVQFVLNLVSLYNLGRENFFVSIQFSIVEETISGWIDEWKEGETRVSFYRILKG